MKIHSFLPTQAVTSSPGQTRPVERAAPVSSAASVSLSEEARWVAGMAEQMRGSPEIRADVVERTRQALLDGTFEREVDMDALIERLARDL